MLLRVLAVGVGAWIVAAVLLSAIRTVVVPRRENLALMTVVFLTVQLLMLPLLTHRDEARRERTVAGFAPLALMALAATWSVLVIIGAAFVIWGTTRCDWPQAFVVSGSSLTTLGLASVGGAPTKLVSVAEALVGLGLVGLLISFLPTMYSIYNRRELLVAKLASRAGTPPSVPEFIRRLHAIHGLEELDALWLEWESWFSELEETHTSYPALVYFRSGAGRSWLTAAGTLLDSAAVMTAAVDLEPRPQAQLCLRTGFLALRELALQFDLDIDPDPRPDGPISVGRAEFEACLDQLATAGVPLRADRDAAWNDFAGWRVNYDAALIGLCTVIEPPSAVWSSDRAPRRRLPVARTIRRAVLSH